MKQFVLLALLMPVMLVIGGCKSGLMMKAPADTVVAPTSDTAVVIFVRPAVFGGAIQSVVYDVTDTQSEFIGVVSSGMKVGYRVRPGEKMFMVVSEAADFLKATVDAGKTYYVLVTPRFGAWRARFSLKPVRGEDLTDKKIAGWGTSMKFYENTEASRRWAVNNSPDVEQKRAEYLVKWNKKSQKDKDEATLLASDGR